MAGYILVLIQNVGRYVIFLGTTGKETVKYHACNKYCNTIEVSATMLSLNFSTEFLLSIKVVCAVQLTTYQWDIRYYNSLQYHLLVGPTNLIRLAAECPAVTLSTASLPLQITILSV